MVDVEKALNKPPETFAEHLDRWMITRKVTNPELAKEIGVHRYTIGKWRNGKAEPQEWYHAKIEEVTGLRLKYE